MLATPPAAKPVPTEDVILIVAISPVLPLISQLAVPSIVAFNWRLCPAFEVDVLPSLVQVTAKATEP